MLSNFLPEVVQNKNFLKLWFAQITSQIALNGLYFILTLKIYELTHSSTAVSLLILAFTIPNIFFGYLAGVFVDQLSLKKVMLTTNLIRSGLLLLVFLFLNNSVFLLIIVLLLSLATLFFVPAEGAAIPALVSLEDLISANSLFALTLQLAVVTGFLLGGFSLKLFGEHLTVLGVFLLFCISFLLNYFLPDALQSKKESESGEKIFIKFLKGIVFVLKTKVVRDSVFFLTLSTTIIFILATIGPGYVDKVLKLDVNLSAAFVVTPATIGFAVGSLVIGKIGAKQDQRLLVNIGLIGMAVTFLLLSMISQRNNLEIVILAFIFVFLLGIENSFITIPVTTDFQKNTPEELRGRAYGLLSTFISGFAALPVLISGAIADAFSARSVLIALGILVLAIGIYRLRRKKYNFQN